MTNNEKKTYKSEDLKPYHLEQVNEAFGKEIKADLKAKIDEECYKFRCDFKFDIDKDDWIDTLVNLHYSNVRTRNAAKNRINKDNIGKWTYASKDEYPAIKNLNVEGSMEAMKELIKQALKNPDVQYSVNNDSEFLGAAFFELVKSLKPKYEEYLKTGNLKYFLNYDQWYLNEIFNKMLEMHQYSPTSETASLYRDFIYYVQDFEIPTLLSDIMYIQCYASTIAGRRSVKQKEEWDKHKGIAIRGNSPLTTIEIVSRFSHRVNSIKASCEIPNGTLAFISSAKTRYAIPKRETHYDIPASTSELTIRSTFVEREYIQPNGASKALKLIVERLPGIFHAEPNRHWIEPVLTSKLIGDKRAEAQAKMQEEILDQICTDPEEVYPTFPDVYNFIHMVKRQYRNYATLRSIGFSPISLPERLAHIIVAKIKNIRKKEAAERDKIEEENRKIKPFAGLILNPGPYVTKELKDDYRIKDYQGCIAKLLTSKEAPDEQLNYLTIKVSKAENRRFWNEFFSSLKKSLDEAVEKYK